MLQCTGVRMMRCTWVPMWHSTWVRRWRCPGVPMLHCTRVRMMHCTWVRRLHCTPVRMWHSRWVRRWGCPGVLRLHSTWVRRWSCPGVRQVHCTLVRMLHSTWVRRWGCPGVHLVQSTWVRLVHCTWVRSWRWKGSGGLQHPQHQSFPLDPNLPKDVLLFQQDRGRFFRLLGLFCTGQTLFWAYLAHFAFQTLRDTGVKPDPEQGGRPQPTLPGGASLNLGSNKWRFGFTASCLTVGSLILVAGFVFSRRSVGRVLLRRGGQEVTLTTYYPFGFTSTFTVPLRHISCMSHRSEVPAMIPLKIKGRPFYFLLDKEGQITNPKLFDITVGAYRKL